MERLVVSGVDKWGGDEATFEKGTCIVCMYILVSFS